MLCFLKHSHLLLCAAYGEECVEAVLGRVQDSALKAACGLGVHSVN